MEEQMEKADWDKAHLREAASSVTKCCNILGTERTARILHELDDALDEST